MALLRSDRPRSAVMPPPDLARARDAAAGAHSAHEPQVLLTRGWRHCHGADPRLASLPGRRRWTITRIALAFEAGRDGFWLARWLEVRGVEAHVIHASSIAVAREQLGVKPVGFRSAMPARETERATERGARETERATQRGVEALRQQTECVAETVHEGARRASETSAAAFSGAARAGSTLADATQEIVGALTGYVEDVIRNTSQAREALLSSRSMSEMMQVQANLVRDNLQSFLDQNASWPIPPAGWRCAHSRY
jgi:predicted RNase H-like HicB family nuclease